MLDTTLRYLCTQRALTTWACPDMRYAAQAQARLHPGHTRQHAAHAGSSARADSAPQSSISHFAGLFGRVWTARGTSIHCPKLSTLSAPYSQYSPNWVQCRIRQVPQLGPCGRRHASGALLPFCMQRTPAPPLPPAARRPPLRFIARARRRGKAYEHCGGLWGAACAVPHTDAPARDAAWCGGARPRPHGQVRSALATATRRRLCARTAQRIHCGPCGLLSADLWLAHPIGSSPSERMPTLIRCDACCTPNNGIVCCIPTWGMLHPNMLFQNKRLPEEHAR